MTTFTLDPTEQGMEERHKRIPLPPAFDPQLATLQTRVDVIAADMLALKSRVATLEAEPPVPLPSPPRSSSLPVWLPLALSIALLMAQQLAAALHTLPPSTPVTVALVVLTALTAAIPAIEALLQQQQAHALAVERMRRGGVQFD